MYVRTITFSLLAICSIALTACGGSSSSSSSTTKTEEVESTISEVLTITPSLGTISDAPDAATKTTVVVYDEHGPSGGNVLGKSELTSDGTASVQVTYNDLKPAVIEVTAGSNTEYYDEASGTLETLPQGYKLHALTADPDSTAVTPLTEMGYQLALENELFPLSASAVEQVNAAISGLFTADAIGPDVAPALFNQTPAPDSLGASAGDFQAAMLAALAHVGSDEPRPAYTVLEALKKDSSSGWINGSAANGNLITTPYPAEGDPSSFANEWRTALEDYVATYGTNELEERAFLLPLAKNRFLRLSGLSGEKKLKEAADDFTGTVRFSDDNGSEWSTFPEGQQFSARVKTDGSITVHSGDITTEGTSPVSGWSTNVDDAEVVDYTNDPTGKVIRVEVPTSNPDLERYFLMVNYWSDLDIFYLVEDDLTTQGRDRIAHVIHRIHGPWQTFFDDLDTLAQDGLALTQVVDDSDGSRECKQYALGSSDSSYPYGLGVIYSESSQDIYSIQPQQVRFARNGDRREMLFAQNALIRHDTASDRVDVVNFDSLQSGSVKTWATNDPEVISTYCDP